MATRNMGGRPPKYTCVEEVQEKIDKYFNEYCKGHPLTTKDGDTVYNKYGLPIIVDSHVPTITGLALALGFTNRVSLLNYQGKKEFRDAITQAKARVEEYVEERLFDKDGSNGAKFSLQNNFKGWDADKPKPEESKAPAINIICDIPRTAEASVEAAADTETETINNTESETPNE